MKILVALLASTLLSFGAATIPYQQLDPHHFDVTKYPFVTINGVPTNIDVVTYISNLIGTNLWKFDTNTGIMSPSFNPGFVIATNIVAYGFNTTRDVGFLGQHSVVLTPGDNILAMTDLSTIYLNGTTTNPADSLVNFDNGNGFGRIFILVNNSTNQATFTIPQTQAQIGDPTKTNHLRADWTPSQQWESLWLYNTPHGWTEVDRPGTLTNVVDNLTVIQNFTSKGKFYINNYDITTNLFTINPTDGYVPYRASSTNFLNSPWYRISTNKMGFNGTGQFLTSSNFNLGFGAFTLQRLASGADRNTALGGNAGEVITTGTDNTFVGHQSGYHDAIGSLTGSFNTGLGDGSLYYVQNAQNGNTAVGYLALGGDSTLGAGNYNTAIGYAAGNLTTTQTNGIQIGVNVLATNNNEIVIGNTANTKLITPVTGWDGSGTHFHADDGTFKTVGGSGTTINPTDNTMPYRSNSTTFADSPMQVAGTNFLRVVSPDTTQEIDIIGRNNGDTYIAGLAKLGGSANFQLAAGRDGGTPFYFQAYPTNNLAIFHVGDETGKYFLQINRDGPVLFSSLTAATIGGLFPSDGAIVYQNDSTPGFQGKVNGSWIPFAFGTGYTGTGNNVLRDDSTFGAVPGLSAGITTTWTNMITGVITQRISAVGGIIVTNLTL